MSPKPRAKPKPVAAAPKVATNSPPAKPRRLSATKRAVEKRPTEYGTGVVGAIVGLLAAVFDITDPTVLTSMIVVVGFVPAGITWLVKTIRDE